MKQNNSPFKDKKIIENTIKGSLEKQQKVMGLEDVRDKNAPNIMLDRGISKETDEMVYGQALVSYLDGKIFRIIIISSIITNPAFKDSHIMECSCIGHEIIPETLGYATGVKDKNGKEIYQDDIITTNSYPYIDEGKQNYVGIVEWVFAGWQCIKKCVNKDKTGISDGINDYLENSEQFVIVGNIHENPELLEEE